MKRRHLASMPFAAWLGNAVLLLLRLGVIVRFYPRDGGMVLVRAVSLEGQSFRAEGSPTAAMRSVLEQVDRTRLCDVAALDAAADQARVDAQAARTQIADLIAEEAAA